MRPSGQVAELRRPARTWAFEAAVAAFAFVSGLPLVLQHLHGTVTAGAIGLAVIVAPVLVRRVWPLPAFVGVLAASVVVGLTDGRVFCGVALVVALYTVASLRPRTEALWAGATMELGILLALLLFAGSSWWYDAIFVSGLNAAALGLGLYAATRRAYLSELRDRAARLERERDQQAALAAAAERARIAREMHDVVAHHLTVMVALSDGAIAASASSPERATEVMRSVSATGRRALADTRRLVGVLRDRSDGEEPARQPVPALTDLDELIDGVRAAGLPVTLELRGSTRELSEGVQLTIYRLVQEALTNTLKHGGPGASATVRLVRTAHELEVEVVDDGVGLVSSTGAGSGLIGMRERVEAFGGTVSAGSAGGGAGWRVSASLRLDP